MLSIAASCGPGNGLSGEWAETRHAPTNITDSTIIAKVIFFMASSIEKRSI